MIMKSSFYFRALSVVLAIFTLGHTVGTLPKITHGVGERLVVSAMQNFRFPIMGFTRSYWEFYRGFSIIISIDLAVLMIFAWLVAGLSQRNPREAVPFALTLTAACAGNLIVSCLYFFSGPIVMSVLATVLATMGLVSLVRVPSSARAFA